MRIGEFDRRVKIEQPVVAVSSGGDRTPTWTLVTWISAKQRFGSTSEKMEQARQQGITQVVYHTRYYPGINATMRLYDEIEGNTYQIHTVNVIGRKEFLEITASWQD